MNTLLNPRWLYLVNGLPLLLLGFLFGRQFTLVRSLLEPATRVAWYWFGGVLAALLVAVFLLVVWLDARRARLSLAHAAGLFLAFAGFLYYAVPATETLVPFSLPRWLRDPALPLYLATFVMPTLVYALLVAVHRLTPAGERRPVWPNFLGALAIPLGAYFVVTVVLPWINVPGGDFWQHLLAISLLLSTVAFLFLLLRGVYLLARGRTGWLAGRRLLWLLPLAVVFPLLGLALNNGELGSLGLRSGGSGIFGDFNHPIFYVLAGLNGLLLCLPQYELRAYRLFLFLARAALLTYIGYFFLVFLPFLPLALVAVIAFGLGFLMLTPLLLFPTQLTILRDDYRYLRRHFSANFLRIAGLTCSLILPAAVTLSYGQDRLALERALDYAYVPATAAERVDVGDLADVLAAVRNHKGRSDFGGIGGSTPYLSPYYRWIVLDNLTLSEQKLGDLERIFYGRATPASERWERTNDRRVALTDHRVTTEWDAADGSWSTWVELELTADSVEFGQLEYATVFGLPPGLLVSDYYLYVGEEREPGILAERRAATWVYNQVVNSRRDPGFLRYAGTDRLALNVFPFAGGEVRRTGIRFRHPEPLRIAIDGRDVQLGRPGEHLPEAPVSSASGAVTYLPAALKLARPRVQRPSRVHLIVDASDAGLATAPELRDRIRTFLATLPDNAPPPRIVLTGTYAESFAATDDWAGALANAAGGGFFAQRAIEDLLAAAATRPPAERPVIVLVPAEGSTPILPDNFATYAAAYPEGPAFYTLTPAGTLNRHRLDREPSLVRDSLARLPAAVPVIAYPDGRGGQHYLPTDTSGAVLVGSQAGTPSGDSLRADGYATGLDLYGAHLAHRRAGRHEDYATWLGEVRGSFRSGFLTPVTAFLVLENEAQREALRRKQAEVLNADPKFDLDEETARMSEPGIWWLLLGLAIVAFGRWHRTRGRAPQLP